MNPILAGLLSAASWGTADFAARFSCRLVGPSAALLAATAVGAAILTVWLALTAQSFPLWPEASAWDIANGIITIASMTLLYHALARGPLSLVSPLVGAYPLWTLLAAVVFAGVRPSWSTWAAIAATMAGMWIVAVGDGGGERGAPGRRATALLSIAAGVSFSLALLCAQQAVMLHGALPALWLGRLIGLGILAIALLPRWRRLRLTVHRVALLSSQGALDMLGYLFLYATGAGLAASIATVISSTFGVVTVALARLVLREPIAPRQWLGILLVFAGVAGLSASDQ